MSGGRGATKDKLKRAFSDLKINLSTADPELVLDVIYSAVTPKEFEDHKDEVIKLLNYRDLSLNFNFKTCYIHALSHNKDIWKPIKKKVSMKGKNGKVVKAELSSVPANALGYVTYLSDKKGISSNERDSEHVINMWKSEVKTDEGKVLFSGIRHGNTRGKESSSRELILAAAVQQYGLNALQKSHENKVWNVSLGNVQLMSPVSKYNPISPDGDLPFKQMDELKKMSQKGPFKVEIKDQNGNIKKITLKLAKVALFNFGTNIQHYIFKGLLIKNSYSRNEEGLKTLFGETIISKNKKFSEKDLKGDVGAYLKELDNSIKKNGFDKDLVIKKKKIINLSKQIIDIWNKTKGKGSISNPAAIQTRLSGLMYLIEYPVSFNCKSGKDRTGNVSSEINDLMISMEANDGDLPEPYKELSDKERLQASDIFDATKSDKISQTNTGYKGLKIGLKETEKRIGKVKGTSSHAKL